MTMNNHNMEIVEFADPIPMSMVRNDCPDADRDNVYDCGNVKVNVCGTNVVLNDVDIIRSKFRLLYRHNHAALESMSLGHCYEAFDDLCTMGVVHDVDLLNCVIRLNLNRLYNIGYVLMYDINKCIPIFTKCNDLSYIYNCILYMSDFVYIESLESYKIIKIKQNFTS